MRTHSYIVDTTPDITGRIYESPYAVKGFLHTPEQDNMFYERYIAPQQESPQENVILPNSDILKKKLLLLGSQA